ncbi:probable F-box protein At2g36090 [Mangifera indica]|uniref:probable F-box protein At2g36090 n=1 Tax=Mangifera indica TaxID=29780 RepID=UPI001CFB8558|nr:probable F-box protein At2g36090 [Mangifera indica]
MASSPTTDQLQALCDSISTVHPDVIQNHILTKLDGQTLVVTASASSQLRSLSLQDNLWRKICTSTWPSTNHPRVQTLISTFPAAHRSFFSDSFPVLDCQIRKSHSKHAADQFDNSSELISAVDIHYQNNPILSKVVETETVTGWFQFPPFIIDLLDEKQLVPTPIKFVSETKALIRQLEENLSLSWIIIYSNGRRAVNLSSRWPISVEQHWLTREVHVKYAAVVVGSDHGRWWQSWSTREFVECEVTVTLRGEEGGEMSVREVYMQMDLEERNLNGRESLVILRRAVGMGKRSGRREVGKERYKEFMEKKIERKEGKERVEKALSRACVCCFLAAIAFSSYKLFINIITLLKYK